jgi:membrane-bound ClpP family serine protease
MTLIKWLYRILFAAGLALIFTEKLLWVAGFLCVAGLVLGFYYVANMPTGGESGAVSLPVGATVPENSLQYQTAMRAMKSGKPCIGEVNDKGEMEFKELEWPDGHKGINL